MRSIRSFLSTAACLFAAGCTTVPVAPPNKSGDNAGGEVEADPPVCDDTGPAEARKAAVRVRRRALFTRAADSPALEAGADAKVAQHCPFGMPALARTWAMGPTRVIGHDGYALEHSAIDKIAYWVCELVETRDLEKVAKRRDKFLPDPALAEAERATLADYAGSGYDRGHQAPSANRSADQRLQDETFYLSNMAPQVPTLNQGIWRILETKVRDWVKKRGRLYMITGPLFYDEAEEDPKTADGVVEMSAIGPGGVGVPTHFFKIIVAEDPGKPPQVIAFVMPNQAYKAPYKIEPYIRTVDWIEERSGIDFLPALDDATEARVEATPSQLW